MAAANRSATATYQVHSQSPDCLPREELQQVVQRYQVPFGHLQVEIVNAESHPERMDELLPQPKVFHPELPFEIYARLRRTRWVYRVEVQEAEPEDLGYLRAGMLVAGEIAALCEGTIYDATAYQVFDAQHVARQLDRSFTPFDHLSLHVDLSPRPYWVHTHGMAKFGHPDFQLFGVPDSSLPTAKRLLLHLSAAVIAGGSFRAGESANLCGFSFQFGNEGGTSGHFQHRVLALSSFSLLEQSNTPAMQGMLACSAP